MEIIRKGVFFFFLIQIQLDVYLCIAITDIQELGTGFVVELAL